MLFVVLRQFMLSTVLEQSFNKNPDEEIQIGLTINQIHCFAQNLLTFIAKRCFKVRFAHIKFKGVFFPTCTQSFTVLLLLHIHLHLLQRPATGGALCLWLCVIDKNITKVYLVINRRRWHKLLLDALLWYRPMLILEC